MKLGKIGLHAVAAGLTVATAGCTVPSQFPSHGRVRFAPGARAAPPASRRAPAGAQSGQGGQGGQGGQSGQGAPVQGADATMTGCVDETADVPGTIVAALAIEPGVWQGCLTNGDDVDVYSLTAPDNTGGTLYRIVMQPVPALNLEGTVYNADREQQAHGYDSDNGVARKMWAHVAAGTIAYIKIEPYIGISGSRAYTLDIQASPVVDPDEPNDFYEAAKPLALGTPHQAVFSAMMNMPRSHVDEYLVRLPRAGTLSVVVQDAGPAIEWEINIYDRDKNHVAKAHANNDGATLRMRAQLAKGSYVLRLGRLHDRKVAAAGVGAPPLRVLNPYTITATLE